MKSSLPLVSIGMPVRNCQDTLILAMRSILSQTYEKWKLLLIDDGSTDDTLLVARSLADPRIKVYADGQTRGLANRLNEALGLSCGKYFARMDGDDVAYPHRIERQIHYLETHPEIDLVGAGVLVFIKGGCPFGKRTVPGEHEAICSRPIAGFPIVHPTYVGHLKWFRRYGYYGRDKKSQDQDLLLRSYRYSRFANLPEILLGYREEKLSLRKILSTRCFFARSLFREFQRQGRYDLAIRANLEQGMKGLVDCFAVFSGLNYHILKHRARPITAEEHQEWTRVWISLNQ